jgi:hypothetical protein
MKKLLIRLAVTIGLAAAPLTMTAGLAPSAGAQDVVPGVADLAVDLTVQTPKVTPPAYAGYSVEVTQNGALATSGRLTVGLPSGSVVQTGLSDLDAATCAQSGATLTCDFTADPVAGPRSVDLTIITTPPVAGDYTITADVASTDLVEPIEFTANNHDEGTMVVRPTSEGTAAGIVKRGESLSLTLNDGRQITLTVPTTSTNDDEQGVDVTISGKNATGYTCTSGRCGNGFLITFDSWNPTFTWTDETHPLVTVRTYGVADPCLGLGNSCTGIDYTKHPELTLVPLQPMPWCSGASGANAGNGQSLPSGPCINHKFKINGAVWFEVLLTSDDPLELPVSKIGL